MRETQRVSFPALNYWSGWFQFFHNVDWSQRKSWGAANEDCMTRGANLVSIHNQEEEDFLSMYSKGSSKWIGLRNNPTKGGEQRLSCKG